jgi:hypothetical protein
MDDEGTIVNCVVCYGDGTWKEHDFVLDADLETIDDIVEYIKEKGVNVTHVLVISNNR